MAAIEFQQFASALALTGDLTLAMWIDPTDFSNFRGLIGKTAWNVPAPFDLYLETGTGVANLELGNGSSAAAYRPGGVPATGAWSHLAVTVSGSANAVTFYINGEMTGTTALGSPTRGDTGQPVRIGRRADGVTAWLGAMADVRLYNRALAAGEVAALYQLSPLARVSYTASWFDGIDRAIAGANYGAISSFTRPSTPPSSSSTVLVTLTSYNNAGEVGQVTDPMGNVTQTSYDDAGRTTQTVEAYRTSSARTTNYSYTLDNLIATMTAVNSTTGNQTTTWAYGTSSSSGVYRNDLLASVTYPDSVSGSDVVSYTYNRQSQQLTITDQRGTVRTLYYDKLGRQINDCVTTVGTSTDTAVLQIARAYEIRGLAYSITKYNSATPLSGTIVNQVQFTYNTFAQLITDQQSHSGAVGGSTPSVQYAYDTGGSSSNEIRLEAEKVTSTFVDDGHSLGTIAPYATHFKSRRRRVGLSCAQPR